NIDPSKASVRLPRAAVRANGGPGGWVSWALISLTFVLGIMPSAWLREVAPIRKRGPVIVSDAGNLRPIAYSSDLEALFDTVWLSLNREAIERYGGTEQAGGRFDAVAMALGILMA
ncbi:unnamed protein product, partial [Polarella glacialis]